MTTCSVHICFQFAKYPSSFGNLRFIDHFPNSCKIFSYSLVQFTNKIIPKLLTPNNVNILRPIFYEITRISFLTIENKPRVQLDNLCHVLFVHNLFFVNIRSVLCILNKKHDLTLLLYFFLKQDEVIHMFGGQKKHSKFGVEYL